MEGEQAHRNQIPTVQNSLMLLLAFKQYVNIGEN